jgi:hypothetical protein
MGIADTTGNVPRQSQGMSAYGLTVALVAALTETEAAEVASLDISILDGDDIAFSEEVVDNTSRRRRKK